MSLGEMVTGFSQVVTVARCMLSRMQPFPELKGKSRGQRVDTVSGNRKQFEQEG